MQTRLTATELAKSLSDILNRVRYLREGFLIERNGEPIAALVPAALAPVSGVTIGELAARLEELSMPGDGFAEDLEDIQSAQPPAGAPSWPSL